MRTCPRVIKRARHNSYRVKRPGEVSVTHTSPPTIQLEGLRQRPDLAALSLDILGACGVKPGPSQTADTL